MQQSFWDRKTKAEKLKTSTETQHLGVKEYLNAFQSPGFQSTGSSNGLYAAGVHVSFGIECHLL